MSRRDVQELLGKEMHELGDMDYDETWRALSTHIDYKFARLVACRDEMQVKLQRDRTRRAARREAIRNR